MRQALHAGKAVPASLPRRKRSRQHDEEVQLYTFDILALAGEDLRGLPLSMRTTKLARRLSIFVAAFEQVRDLFRAACNMGLAGS